MDWVELIKQFGFSGLLLICFGVALKYITEKILVPIVEDLKEFIKTIAHQQIRIGNDVSVQVRCNQECRANVGKILSIVENAVRH